MLRPWNVLARLEQALPRPGGFASDEALQTRLQKAADGLDPRWRAPAAADPHAGVKWGLGGDVPGVVPRIPRFSSAGDGVTP
jgi:hypothetical protein